MLRRVGLPNVHIGGQLADMSVAESSSDSESGIRIERERPRHLQRFDVDVGVDEIAVTLTTDVVKHLAVIQSKFVRVRSPNLSDLPGTTRWLS